MDHGGDKRAAAKTQHEYEKQQFYQQQQLFLQQLQRPQVATPRFPFNIDPRLRPQHHLLHHRPLNPSSSVSAQRIVSNPSALRPNHPNPPVVPINNPIPQQHKLSKQLAYEDAERICHPDFKRPFTSLGDACERLLPYHVAAHYDAEDDDQIFDPANSLDQILSPSQQWENNVAAKIAEFTSIFEKQVTAYNSTLERHHTGMFRTEEELMMEQFLLQEEKRVSLEARAALEARQNAIREAHEAANMQMAAMIHAQSQARNEMMVRASALGYGGGTRTGPNMGEQEQGFQQGSSINVWGHTNAGKDDDKEEPTEDFLNDDETDNGGSGVQHAWPGAGQLDLNAR